MKRCGTARETPRATPAGMWPGGSRSRARALGALAALGPGLGLALLGAIAVGCEGGDRADGGPLVRDSAGVRIVEAAAPEGPPRWTVAGPPVVIGDSEVDGFGLIAGIVTLDDGTVVVGDGFSGEVRFFDGAGAELARAGRRGEGPGEFGSIQTLWRTPGDSVGVWDARFGRYTLLGPAGGVGPTIPLAATAERARHLPLGSLPDGRVLARSDARSVPGLEYYRADWSLVAFASDGGVADTLVRLPGTEMWDWIVERGTVPALIPFGAETWIDLGEDAIWVGTNEAYAIDRLDLTGRLSTRIRLSVEPTPLGAAAIEAYKQEERDKANSSMASKGGNDIFGEIAEDAPYPEHYPWYAGLVVDDAGNAWVRDYPTDPAAPTRLTAFASDGQVLGTAVLPSEFRPVVIEGGRVVGIWRDDLELEHVRVYQLVDGG